MEKEEAVSEVKRYDGWYNAAGGGVVLEEDDDGVFVLHSDYAALSSEVERLEAELFEARQQAAAAKVEGLREALSAASVMSDYPGALRNIEQHIAALEEGKDE